MGKKYFLFSCILLLGCFSVEAQNLIANGDFESGGNGVGFSINSCCYNQINPPFSGSTLTGNYAVTSNPQAMDTSFFPGGDHTSGTGNMLIVNGSTTGGGQRFWRAGNNGDGICGLILGQTYTFSFWIKSVSTLNRANIDHQFVGASNVTLVIGTTLAPLPSAGWQQVAYTFIPTNNCVNFELWDTITTDVGNDFAVDDFSLVGPPLPFTLSYSKINPSCNNNTDGSIVGYGAGANPPYVYTLTGPINTVINGTGIFTGLPAGNYTLNILEGSDGEITINNIILSGPPNLIVSNPATICPNGATQLNVSGGSGYTWTSTPFDNSLVTNSPSPTVSPNQTTVYTVTSATASSNNLVFNGNFSAGNIGFVTDYTYQNPSNPNGAHRTYGITTNANIWSNFFSNCTDHTLGTGNMLVADGSDVNSGNDKVWCQTIPIVPNQNYTFSYWIQTVALPAPANIAVVINGQTIGTQLAASETCEWQPRTYSWNSGTNTTAQICLYDRTTDAIGNDFAIDDISFVGSPSLCNLSAAVTITVNPGTFPDFQTQLSLCSGATAPILQPTSPNGISGVWTPSIINNTTTGNYIFSPNANQCASDLTLSVTVGNAITPTFNISSICAGTTTSPLPSISLNNIVGFWTPAFDNTTTTTYTFNPAPDQCGGGTTFELIVTPKITPTFSSVGPFCIGKVISDPLPLFSLEGISGSWSPAYNNLATTTYTFTPDVGQCAAITTLEVVIIPANLIPTFEFGPYVTGCYQPIVEVPPIALPTTSNNGILGFWTPDVINYAFVGETTYTFMPIVNSCGANYTLTVNIIEPLAFAINAGCDGTDFVLSTDLTENPSNTFTWYNAQGQVISNMPSVIITASGDYSVEVFSDGCSTSNQRNVSVIYCEIPKGISPNADTLNDFFDLSNLNVKKLQIYNRYGTEVYSKSDYKKEWDGTSDNGKALPDGTYYYVINFETGKSKTGWVYINQ